jgi:hypothetical protein
MRNVWLLGLLMLAQVGFGQKYFSKTGKISFYSDAPLEKIEAHNTTASTVIDIEAGSMEWAVLIQGFSFKKALMQEHFNENYMESGKYPKGKFKGKIDNIDKVDFKRDGEYPVTVSGELDIHGVTRPVTAQGVIKVADGAFSASSKFRIKIADYNIGVEKHLIDNIAKEVDITVQADYKPLSM